ncbi:hypothetical protein GCM10010244_55340 [Streptomyces coeruleorubidus]|nr:hypothetical protein GCM10010244_55340 [Streptomyces bellus]
MAYRRCNSAVDDQWDRRHSSRRAAIKSVTALPNTAPDSTTRPAHTNGPMPAACSKTSLLEQDIALEGRRVRRPTLFPSAIGHVQAAEGFHGAVDRGGDLVLVADVAGDDEDSVADVSEVLRGGVQGGFVDVGEGDGGPRLGEGAGGRKAHTGACPRDEDDLAGEVVGGVHVVLSNRTVP